MGKMRNLLKTLVGKYERKKPFEGPRCRCDENIKINFRRQHENSILVGQVWSNGAPMSQLLHY
jgi:hypothetical protein